MVGKKVIVKGSKFGVFYGKLVSNKKGIITLKNARNIWYYKGANNLADIATKGINVEESKVSVQLDVIELIGTEIIIPCTKKASKILKNCKIWSY